MSSPTRRRQEGYTPPADERATPYLTQPDQATTRRQRHDDADPGRRQLLVALGLLGGAAAVGGPLLVKKLFSGGDKQVPGELAPSPYSSHSTEEQPKPTAPNVDPGNPELLAEFNRRTDDPKYPETFGLLFDFQPVVVGETIWDGVKYSRTVSVKNNPSRSYTLTIQERRNTYETYVNSPGVKPFPVDERLDGVSMLYNTQENDVGPAGTIMVFTSGGQGLPPSMITARLTGGSALAEPFMDPTLSREAASKFGFRSNPIGTFLDLWPPRP